jgi:hypothetical protein
MPINLLSAGGGTTTLTTASSASNFTVTIPAATGSVITTAPGTSGNVLTSNGTAWISSTPASPDGTAKAWVNFNGSGGSSIRGSFNVSSVTRNAGGDYTVNFTTAMVDANYAAMVSQDDATNDGWPNIWSNSNVATTSCRIGTGKRPGTGNNDRTYVGFVVFR